MGVLLFYTERKIKKCGLETVGLVINIYIVCTW